MTRTNLYPALTATLLVLSMALVGVFAAPAAVGTADARSAATTPHEPTANYTYSPDSHAPGAEGIGAEHYAVGLEKDLTALHTIVVESEAFDFADCSSTDTEAFGIDRDNDDPGTQTDEGLVTKYKNIDFRANKIVVEFYKEGGIGQSTVHLNTDDQIVARGGNCYDNPDEKGWYQITGRLNGSTNDQTSTDYDLTVKTHYIYVCDCDSRQEAVDKLGPPPSQESEGGGDESTATPTPAPTESSGGGDATATPTPAPTESSGGGDDGTATATPGDTGGDDSSSTATPTSGNGDDNTTDAANTTNTSDDGTSAPNGSDTGTNSTSNSSTNSSSTNGSSDVGGDSDVGGTTPTSSGNGPGFGFIAAIGALAAGGLLVRRRDD